MLELGRNELAQRAQQRRERLDLVGGAMLDRLATATFDGVDAGSVLHERLTQELVVGPRAAELRLDLPFAERGDVSLKKIGLELIVAVDGQKRTLALPPALGDYRPVGAALRDGALHVTFDGPGRD